MVTYRVVPEQAVISHLVRGFAERDYFRVCCRVAIADNLAAAARNDNVMGNDNRPNGNLAASFSGSRLFQRRS